MIIDRELENKDAVVELIKKYGVKKVVKLAYQLEANKIIERDYKPIVNALSKMLNRGSTNGIQNLSAVF